MQIVSLVRPLVVALIEVAAHAAVPAHGADPAGGLEYPLAVAPATGISASSTSVKRASVPSLPTSRSTRCPSARSASAIA